MSIFDSPLSLDQEVLARGKRGKITGVMFTAAGLSYRVAFPLVSGDAIVFVDEQMFSAADVSLAPPRNPYVVLYLDGMYAVACRTKADFDAAVESAEMQGKPHMQWVWCPAKKHYIGSEACRSIASNQDDNCFCCYRTEANNQP